MELTELIELIDEVLAGAELIEEAAIDEEALIEESEESLDPDEQAVIPITANANTTQRKPRIIISFVC
jgi:hypothetical protein